MNIWWIQSVYVNPGHRRQGLFTALYEHAKQESKKAGACGLRLYADNSNLRAHKTVWTPSAVIAARCHGRQQGTKAERGMYAVRGNGHGLPLQSLRGTEHRVLASCGNHGNGILPDDSRWSCSVGLNWSAEALLYVKSPAAMHQ